MECMQIGRVIYSVNLFLVMYPFDGSIIDEIKREIFDCSMACCFIYSC